MAILHKRQDKYETLGEMMVLIYCEFASSQRPKVFKMNAKSDGKIKIWRQRNRKGSNARLHLSVKEKSNSIKSAVPHQNFLS